MSRLAMLVIVAATVTLSAQAGTLKEEIKASSGQTLDLRLETAGSVRIVGSDEPAVRVEGGVTGRDAADVVVKAIPTSRGVEISAAYASPRGNRSSRADFEIHVPRRFNVHVASMSAAVHVTDVEGTIDGGIMGGDLVLTGLRGRVSISAMAGDIRLTRSEVEGTVATMNGNVLMDDVVGDVRASSMNGRVERRNVRAAGPAREIRLASMSAAIDVGDALAGASVSTMRGDVRIRSAKPFVRASTMGGDIQLDAVDGWIEATTMGGNLTATMVGDPASGDRHVKLIATAGDITLTVPDGLDMRIDVTLGYTRNSPQNYTIQSDFPVQHRRTDEWITRNESTRRYVYGSGTVGSGTHLVEIEVVNGNVTIRRQPRP
jgi:DUF4097 and DUF4098 domain-containing protein YvlB